VLLARVHGLVVLLCLVGGCTALDRFDFSFATDGGPDLAVDAGAPDLLGVDLRGSGIAFGEPCNSGDACRTYEVGKPLECVTNVPGQQFPDGICTRSCTPGVGACSDVLGVGQGAECVTISGQNFCMPRCNTPVNVGCRKNWSCCNGTNTAAVGDCAPSNSDYCR
jgi:hypothetical protein